jgi:LmbE family N-acetylglucosaminyl deacetylase
MSRRTVVVSTHLDDAVFSCWSVFAEVEEVSVVTVFTGGPQDDRVGAWDAENGVTSRERMVQRVAENEAALALAGARAVNLGLLESQYGYEDGPLGPHHLRDALADAGDVYIPAGTGVERIHPDHVLVREVCRAVRGDAILYADNPYCLFRDDPEFPSGLGAHYQRRVIELDPPQRRAKAEAIQCYAGEIGKLEREFGPLTDPDRLMYEVFWKPLSSAAPCAAPGR